MRSKFRSIWVGLSIAIALSIGAHRAHAAAAWDLNDVSVLLPLEGARDYLTSTSRGEFGVVLPRALFDKFQRIIDARDQDGLYRSLTVLGVRIDPCFRGQPNDTCQAQIRLVLQPITLGYAGGEGRLVANDAAVHLFYRVEPEELRGVLCDLWALKNQASQKTEGAPLWIHPALAAEGLNGAFAKRFQKILLAHIGEKRLIRATRMALRLAGAMWDFAGLDRVGQGYGPGAWKATTVLQLGATPEIQSANQTITIGPAGATALDYLGSVAPGNIESRELYRLLGNSEAFKRAASETEVRMAAHMAHRLQNPLERATGQVDCVSCHAARGTLSWLNAHFAELDLNADPIRFTSGLNLTNRTQGGRNVKNLRAFGYFGIDPSVSDRTIFESALTAERLRLDGPTCGAR